MSWIPFNHKKNPLLCVFITLITLFLLSLFFPLRLQADDISNKNDLEYLKKLPLEKLLEIDVTSVSKKEEKMTDAAAAIFVITSDDICRSGATSIADALRLVPGLQVAQLDSKIWAISARGMNSRFANKLLVLMDGRIVYSPAFSGVFWNLQDTFMDDIDRIEVIRGPGATLWGANAVNGVINIITKSATKTHGGLITTGMGTHEKYFGGIRYGNRINDNISFRIYSKYLDRSHFIDSSGNATHDDWDSIQAGFRIDGELGDANHLTIQGDIIEVLAGQLSTPPANIPPYYYSIIEDVKSKGKNLLFRLQHDFSNDSELSLQFYMDITEYNESLSHLKYDVYDFSLEHYFQLANRHEVIWGLGTRLIKDVFSNDTRIAFNPDSCNEKLISAFVQDNIILIKDYLRFIIGSKIEHNDHTGYSIQPSGRLTWTPHKNHSLWGAVSRAVRMPSRGENSFNFDIDTIFPESTLPVKLSLIADQSMSLEELLAYEFGYRFHPYRKFSVDLALFYNEYEKLGTLISGETIMILDPDPYLQMFSTVGNTTTAESYGIELAIDWLPLNWLRLRPTYTFLSMNSESSSTPMFKDDFPRHQCSLMSSMDLPCHLQLNLWLRFVDKLTGMNVLTSQITNVGSYTTIDAHLSWKPRPDLEFSIVGQNLLDRHHPEFVTELFSVANSEIERSVYGKIQWLF